VVEYVFDKKIRDKIELYWYCVTTIKEQQRVWEDSPILDSFFDQKIANSSVQYTAAKILNPIQEICKWNNKRDMVR